MAVFKGTLDEFYTFIGPRTSDLVTKYARPYRQGKECKEIKVENGIEKLCKKRTRLDAAHLKGRERKILIQEILDEKGHTEDGLIFKIDLKVFEKAFEEKHESFHEVIRFMCRKHHKRYDIDNKIITDENDLVTVENEEIVFDKDLTEDLNGKELKEILMIKLTYLSKGDCSIASLHHENWNFNLNKSTKIGYLLCLNQFDRSVVILEYDFRKLDVEVNLKDDKKKISLNIPYNESEFIEKKLGYVFTIMEVIEVQ